MKKIRRELQTPYPKIKASEVEDLAEYLMGLTQAEVNQIKNINLTTISAAQWVYLGALNQALTTTSSPTFAGLTVTGESQVIRVLGSATINAQTTSKQSIYTVPAGLNLIPLNVLVYSVSASLAGLTDMDIGGNANADDWMDEQSLTDFTTGQYGNLASFKSPSSVYAAATNFGVKINTGSTGAATFTAAVIGFLY